MNNQSSKYHYHIEDSINGLTINYHGYKSWWSALLLIGGGFFETFLCLYIINDMLSNTQEQKYFWIIIPIFFLFLLFFLSYQTIIFLLDSLFDNEYVVIDDQCIHIRKWGVLSLERNKTISKTDNLYFFTTLKGFENSISISRSRILSHLNHRGFLRNFNLNPMRSFFKGISVNDATSIMGKIKSKYPQYNVIGDNLFGWDLRDKK